MFRPRSSWASVCSASRWRPPAASSKATPPPRPTSPPAIEPYEAPRWKVGARRTYRDRVSPRARSSARVKAPWPLSVTVTTCWPARTSTWDRRGATPMGRPSIDRSAPTGATTHRRAGRSRRATSSARSSPSSALSSRTSSKYPSAETRRVCRPGRTSPAPKGWPSISTRADSTDGTTITRVTRRAPPAAALLGPAPVVVAASISSSASACDASATRPPCFTCSTYCRKCAVALAKTAGLRSRT